MHVYGLVGYPLHHSFSEKYFSEKFKEEKLYSVEYQLFPIKDISEIRQLLEIPDLKGLNVTIPYKQVVLNYLHDNSNIPHQLDACNCIKIIDGKTYGYNTDVIGFEQSLIPYLKAFQNKALILGNGGAAEAVKYVFRKNHISYKIVSRTIHKDSDLTYQDLTNDIITHHSIIVNTTPLGMYPYINNCPDIPYSSITREHCLFDLVYNPFPTLFLQKGEQQGATIKNGMEMLTIQAEESWKIWNRQ